LRYQPSPSEIERLIRAAGEHPLGEDFLIHGHLGAVAIIFKCHAFTVTAARNELTARRGLRKES